MTYTAEYIMGITEGRAFLRQFSPDLEDMRHLEANCVDALKGYQSGGPVADMLRGERDFWRNQIKKAG